MKAIDTEYNGYKFRSRLEARWAVFFDVLGIKYEYEVEGYEFSDGTKYLPDFWLPTFEGGIFARFGRGALNFQFNELTELYEYSGICIPKPAERRNQILELLNNGEMTSAALSQQTNISNRQIRRDLGVLLEEQKITKTKTGYISKNIKQWINPLSQ